MMRSVLCCVLLMVLGLAGCVQTRSDAALGVTDEEVCDCVPVCRIIGSTAGGTGIPLGNNLILTARHVVKDRFLQVNGRWSRYRTLAKGEGENDDWIVLHCRGAPDESNVELAPGYTPRPGEPLFLLGYWQGHSTEKMDVREARRLPLRVVRAEAASAPMSLTLSTEGLMFCTAPLQGTSYHGISGGPVAAYDEQTGKFRVVGVYKGCWEVTFMGVTRTLHTYVPLPRHAIQAALRDE
jgi:hypothetical protein